ncbi:NAD(P)H-dependent flavin oxidoreductase [Bosea sp. PAMC 26642]|uniref:NAD(P)H-dependent flavin oxidoreductase n=1 Tax=Bosea sp. (strain PAMC 26642) TaxID=1792307 RepID=UPI003FA41925
MAGSVGSAMVIAVSEAGGLGSLPCATLDAAQLRDELGVIRNATAQPFNVNFFCHRPPSIDLAREAAWRRRLEAYYHELCVDPAHPAPITMLNSFDREMCDTLLESNPRVVSFHFGLPDPVLVDRIKASGAKLIASATSVEEARWLEHRGCDAIIAQGFEAGGHRGMFLEDDIACQTGLIALVPQVVDAVRVPVIAAGGIADARGIMAALALGASAAQIGTAYLLCPEAKTSAVHRIALKDAKDNATALTNAFTGRPARAFMNRIIREVGPISELSPDFPLAAAAVTPLRLKAEAAGSSDFSPLWSGQAAVLARELPAGELTRAWGAAVAAGLGPNNGRLTAR